MEAPPVMSEMKESASLSNILLQKQDRMGSVKRKKLSKFNKLNLANIYVVCSKALDLQK